MRALTTLLLLLVFITSSFAELGTDGVRKFTWPCKFSIIFLLWAEHTPGRRAHSQMISHFHPNLTYKLIILESLGGSLGSGDTSNKSEDEQLLQKALREAQNGKWDQALATARKSVDSKQSATANHLISQIYLVKGDMSAALKHIKMAYELDPSVALKSYAPCPFIY